MSRQPSPFKMILVGVAVFIFAALNLSPATAQTAATPKLPEAQIEQLVAPIALYPDSLLSQVLMASTYPLEVVAAARWSQANPSVTGDALQTAMQQQPWDPSVKALTALPQTLQMMNEKLEWTQQLGDAFLAQQGDVLNAVQQLRARADANGQLNSTAQQTVTKTPRASAPQPSSGGGGGTVSAPATVYAIESSNPDEYYVPIYDPGVVYGAWPYSSYPPYSWYPPGYAAGNALSFAAGVFVGSAIWGNVNWGRNSVQINPLRYNSFNRTNINVGNGNWAHDPGHRGAVPYRDAGVAQRFNQQRQSAARESFRGNANAGRSELGKPGAGNKIGQGAGNKVGQGAGNKVGQGAGNKVGQGAGNKVGQGAGNKAGQGAGNKAGQGVGNKVGQDAGNKVGNKAGNKVANNKGKGTGANKSAGNKVAANKNTGGTKHAKSTQGNRGAQTARPNVNRGDARPSGGGGARVGGGGGGGGRGGGGGGGGRGGGGRRSDVRLKHDVVLLGHLDNGLGFYRFSYNGSEKAYVGVMAQEVYAIMPQAVARDRDGYLRVFYDKLGVPFQSYDHWLAAGARIPAPARPLH